MAFTRFNDATDFNNKGARSLPDQPTISADALKRKFDEDARDVVAPKVNVIVGELEDPTASASLGAVAPTGFSGTTVQAVLNSIASGVGTAVADAHTHSNKMLLDTYTQTETNLADAVTKKHDHSNKSLLDTYEQTETNLADAVSKKHAHSNKAVLDKFSEVSGDPYYDGNPIGGGGGGTWGSITGTLSDQTDLNNALAAKADSSDVPTDVSDLNNDLGFQTASDVSTAVAAKSTVSWNQITGASGNTKIATITIDSTPTDIYAPSSGGGGGATSFAGLDDVSLSGTPSAGQIVQYTTVGADVKLRNVNMPTIPTKVSDLTNDSGFQTATDVSSSIGTAIGALDVTTTGAGAGKTLSALSETDGKISATFQNISITKSQVSDFPTIPDELSDLTTDVAISSPTDGQVLTYDYANSKWKNQNPASGGHTMSPTPSSSLDEDDVVDAVIDALTIDGGENEEVPSLYGMGQWTNTDCIILMAQVDQGDDGLGEWNDDWEEEVTPQRSGWLWDESLYQILEDGVGNRRYDIHIEPIFDVADQETVSLYSWRIDDDYENSGTPGGCVAFKFNGEIQSTHAYVGIKITKLRTKYKVVTPLT